MRYISSRRSGDRPPRLLSRAASSISLGGTTLTDDRPSTSPTSTIRTNSTATSRQTMMSSDTINTAFTSHSAGTRYDAHTSPYRTDLSNSSNEKHAATSSTITARARGAHSYDSTTLYADMAENAARIWALYDAGVPLFTREVLERLARQLDNTPGVRSGQHNVVVAIKGMDGRRVRVHTASGTYTETIHPDIVLMNVRPQIEYWTIEKLTGNAIWHMRRFDPARAAMPIRITHIQEARYRNAVGTVSPTGYSTVAELATALAQRVADDNALGPPVEDPRRRKDRERSGTITRDPAAADIRALFANHRATWDASEACRELRETLFASLAPQLVPRGKAVVRKIVAFACSSMDDELKPKDRERHAVQHAMLLTVRDVIKQIQADIFLQQPVDVYCQDPMYMPADATVLAENGITVLEDPHAFLAVDETTIVVAVAPSVPVRQIVADLARPVAMIWSRLQVQEKRTHRLLRDYNDTSTGSCFMAGSISVDDAGGWSDPASSRVRQMLESGYAEFDFPWDPAHFGTVDGVAVYVRTGLREAGVPWDSSGSSSSSSGSGNGSGSNSNYSNISGCISGGGSGGGSGCPKLPLLQVTTLQRPTDEVWGAVLQRLQRTFLCSGDV